MLPPGPWSWGATTFPDRTGEKVFCTCGKWGRVKRMVLLDEKMEVRHADQSVCKPEDLYVRTEVKGPNGLTPLWIPRGTAFDAARAVGLGLPAEQAVT